MKPSPKGWPRLSVSLYYEEPRKAIEWLCRAFGFEVRIIVDGEEGRVAHSELVFGEAVLMVGSAGDDGTRAPAASGGPTAGVFLYVGISQRGTDHLALTVVPELVVVLKRPRAAEAVTLVARIFAFLFLLGVVWWGIPEIEDGLKKFILWMQLEDQASRRPYNARHSSRRLAGNAQPNVRQLATACVLRFLDLRPGQRVDVFAWRADVGGALCLLEPKSRLTFSVIADESDAVAHPDELMWIGAVASWSSIDDQRR